MVYTTDDTRDKHLVQAEAAEPIKEYLEIAKILGYHEQTCRISFAFQQNKRPSTGLGGTMASAWVPYWGTMNKLAELVSLSNKTKDQALALVLKGHEQLSADATTITAALYKTHYNMFISFII